MPAFQMVTNMSPCGDQPQAIAALSESLRAGHRYQTLLGVTGSGKSVVATTPVLVRRGEIVALEPIGPLVDSLLASSNDRVRRVGDTEMLRAGDAGEPVEVLSFDPLTGAVGWKPVTEFLRHRSPPTLWEVETACGRTVTATGDHNFFVLREGDLRLVRTVDVRPGDHLPLPRHIPEPMVPLGDLGLADEFGNRRVYVTVPCFSEVWETEADTLRPLLTQAKVRALVEGRERVAIPLYRHLVAAVPALAGDARFGTRRRTYEMPAALPITADLLRLLGYYVAEGHGEDRYCILSSADPEIADAVLRTARSLGLRTYRRPETHDYHIYSRLWAGLLTRWCGRDARSKRLPPFWLQLSDADLAGLLAAYFAGDGGVDGDEVTCMTASQQLASDLSYALLRFDIVARLHRRRMRVPGRQERRTYWRLSISGQPFLKKFHDLIGFGLPRKDARLRAIIGQNENTNVDVIPLSGQALRRVRTILGLIQREVAARAGCVRPMLSLIEHGRRRPSRALAERLLAALKAEAAGQGCGEALRYIGQMEGLLNLFWTPVRAVAGVPGESFVYDLAVADNENFLAGWGGLFVHNTYTMARVIEQINRPALVLAHNKTLAAQLYGEFRDFFPHNAVRYFVSYYDYYQPEAYVPQTDLYVAKDASINEEIDRLRHASTKALMERRDVIVVASVSCIYGLGRPEDYKEVMLLIRKGERRSRDEIVRRLVEIQYERNDVDFARGRFRVRGDVIEVFPAYEDRAVRIDLYGDEVERIVDLDPLTGEIFEHKDAVALWPARHWVTTEERLERALALIETELGERLDWFRSKGKLLEAQRLEFRTRYDMELLREAGTCPGIENYSRHLDGRAPGERPGCLIDYFPRDLLLFADESHVTLPQVRGMLEGDRSRKRNLVEFGFRLPSACDNRPLAWEEFDALIPQAVFVSATPGPYEMEVSQRVVEQVVRPTGLVDPRVEVRPAQGQVDDLIGEIKTQVARGDRTLATTLTKRMAEDLSAYLAELGFKVHYLHSEVDTLQRVQILKDLRLGAYDVLVGINLLREGLDLPEVSLVAILDADREGFLRSETALIQTMGRAARHIDGRVLLYADDVTDSMRRAIAETNRRREVQVRYNAEHGITPASVSKPIRDMIDLQQVAEEIETYRPSSELLTAEELIRLAETQRAKVPWDVARLLMLSPAELEQTVEALERAMRRAAAELQFEKAAALRDQIAELRKGLGEPFFAPAGRGRGRGRGGTRPPAARRAARRHAD